LSLIFFDKGTVESWECLFFYPQFNEDPQFTPISSEDVFEIEIDF